MGVDNKVTIVSNTLYICKTTIHNTNNVEEYIKSSNMDRTIVKCLIQDKQKLSKIY